jgi:3-oxoacyl-[acyl-carrier protein] reductase
MSSTGSTSSGLDGRAAIVTGASRNIGRAIATALGAEGAKVLVHGHRDQAAAEATARLVEEAGSEAELFLGDLADPAIPAEIAAAAERRFGRLDIVVNNAAIRPEGGFEEISYEIWRQVFAIGLDSVFLLSQAALPALRKSDQAAIIHIGGLTGHTGAARRAHVVAAKAAIAGLTKAMAHDLAGDGVTVNCVAPGLIATEREGAAAVARPAHHATRTNLAGRRGTALEVAALVRYLAGAEARYVTGQTLHLNGGAFLS